jgi:hypothetical protein
MGLPENNIEWPPERETSAYDRMRVNATWYGGDPAKLGQLYGGTASTSSVSSPLKHAISRWFGWFWAKYDATAPDDKIHVPIAQDIAQLSSELLFGEGVRFVVKWPETLADGQQLSVEQTADLARTQSRLDKIIDETGFIATLIAAAETAAALGRVGFRISYDATTMSMPTIARIEGDALVPEYRFGQLEAVTFWSIVYSDGDTRWRHLERHERGRVYHGLYRGSVSKLGMRLPLADHPATASLAALVDDESSIAMIENRLDAISVPNLLPDPLDRLGYAGRSDFSPGAITLFDAIDRTMTSLMRDIEDGRSRLLVADYMLEKGGPGGGASFDPDQRLFTRLKRQPGESGDAPIDQVQFRIRVEEHVRALDMLVRRVMESCGYTPSADQGESNRNMTATEFSGRAKKSLMTREKKLRYFRQIEHLLETLIHVDARFFGSGVTAYPVRLEVPDAVQPSIMELAQTVALVRSAQAASTEVLIGMLHPDWSPKEVSEEAAKVRSENGLSDPTLVGLFGPADLPGEPLPAVES